MEDKPRKIKSYIPRNIAINSQHTYKDFIKKRHRLLSNFEFKNYDSGIGVREEQKSKMKRYLLKIAKQQKYVGKLDLRRVDISHRGFLFPAMIYFAKRVTNTRRFSLFDRKLEKYHYKGIAEKWPKYIKNMKQLNYAFMYQHYHRFSLFNEELPKPFNGPFPTISSFLKFQSKMKNLELYLHDQDCKELNEYLRFENYPAGLEGLALIRCQAKEIRLNSSLTRFKNLKTLNLDLVLGSTLESVNTLLKLTPQMIELENLRLSLPPNVPEGQALSLVFKEMKTLKKLKKVVLISAFTPLKDCEEFLEVIKDCPIRILKIWTLVKSDEEIDKITNLLANFKDLETLDIYITHEGMVKRPETIERLFKNIDELYLLKRFQIDLHSRENNQAKKKTYLSYKLILNKIFTKKVPLEAFYVGCNQYSISNQDFMDLLDLLKPLSSSLTKLGISLGEIKSNKIDLEAALETIQGLNNLRSLKLWSLSLASAKCFMGFIETIYTLKYLRSLTIGEVKGTVSKPKYVDGVERILTKRGLQAFMCEISSAFKESLNKKSKACPDINLTEIRKKNPWLSVCVCGPILEKLGFSADLGIW